MILYNYVGFLNEADGNKKIPFFISQRLKGVLSKLDSPIAKKILSIDKSMYPYDETTELYDFSYLDCEPVKDKEDKVTFLPAAKAFDVPGYLPDSKIPCGDCFKAKGRQEMGVGRIVNRLFPDTYTQKQIEDFINDFKAELKKALVNLKLAEGEEIRYWYLDSRYADQHKGDVNNSCMKGAKAQPYFDIYCNNPEKCKLLVLLNDDNKLMGRALVWFGLRKPTGKIYMDRIYTINDADKKLYTDYAVQNGWLHKNKQVMHDASYIENGKLVYSSVAIQLKPVEYKQYPSLDTFGYYTPSTGRLGSNAGNYVPGNPRYQLNSTDGRANKIDR